MHQSTVFGSGFVGLLTAATVLLVFSATATAQVEQHSRISVQGTGLFLQDSHSDSRPLSQSTTTSGGLLVGYSYQFNSWAGIEGNYGYSQYTVNNSGLSGSSTIRSDFHEVTGAFVMHLPRIFADIRPYGLFGAGALIFNPTDDAKSMNPGIDRQTKAAFLYGGGLEYGFTRNFGVRAEYRGFIYKAADFNSPALNVDKVTHLAQPSVGFHFRF